MIRISQIAHKIEKFLTSKEEDKFKIFIRINFNIDVYVCTNNINEANKYQEEFIKSLKDETINQDYEDSQFYIVVEC